ncbi:hypothetical protein AVEN_108922-1 [Araneus ventricosus]|uniref:Uncharacterized protein n=1 Tax=Araneus ventricosus TaxID=182803 RepID=A0A4Y2EP29_ARAVE|nr:hypothetical protein AVEN_108922-1 [Araneus ventricosus]
MVAVIMIKTYGLSIKAKLLDELDFAENTKSEHKVNIFEHAAESEDMDIDDTRHHKDPPTFIRYQTCELENMRPAP